MCERAVGLSWCVFVVGSELCVSVSFWISVWWVGVRERDRGALLLPLGAHNGYRANSAVVHILGALGRGLSDDSTPRLLSLSE